MEISLHFALSAWWHAPVIHRSDLRKGYIRVEPTDNIMVARVQVTSRNGQGQVIEKGEATQGKGNWWKFKPHVNGKSILAEVPLLSERGRGDGSLGVNSGP